MEITNRTLAILVLVAIVVSVAGTIVSLNKLSSSGLSGYVTSNATGTAQVEIQSNTVLRFNVASIDFGTGYVNTTGNFNNCTMDVNASTTINKVGCVNFNDTSDGPFVLENAGTTFLNVTINSSKNASTFIGGTNPLYQYTISPYEAGACGGGTLSGSAWTDTVALSVVNICTNLSYSDSTDSLRMGVRVRIPVDSLTGSQVATFLAQGTSLS